MKNVLILGATSDMALAIARKYAEEHWCVTLAGRDKEALEAIAGDLKIRSESSTRTALFDAVEFDNHAGFYEKLEEKPDVVIACFGYMGDQEKIQSDFQEVRKTIDANFTGMVSILNIVANDFETRGRGSIAAISSVAGDRGRQSNYVYGSAKAGLTAYLSGLRNRLAIKGVHVMTIKPGFVRTKMTENMELPSSLTATPEQVAEAVFNGIAKKRNVVYVLWMWQFIMLVIQHIPEPIFKKMKL